MRFLPAGLVFLLVLTGLELHWQPWRFVTGAFGPRRYVVEGPGGEYGLLNYDLRFVLRWSAPQPLWPDVRRLLIVAGPLGTLHAAHVASIAAASVAGLLVLAMSKGPVPMPREMRAAA